MKNIWEQKVDFPKVISQNLPHPFPPMQGNIPQSKGFHSIPEPPAPRHFCEHCTEESKVKPKTRPLSPGTLEKKAQVRLACFWRSVFEEQAPPRFRRRPATALILECSRREWDRGSPNQRCPRGGVASSLVFAWLITPREMRQIESSTTPNLGAVEFLEHLL